MSISGGGGPFNPTSITIPVGTRLTWTNTGNARARVRDFDHNLIDSDDLQPGQSYSFTFCVPRTVQIGDHRGKGWASITVVSASANPSPTPSPSPGVGTSDNVVRVTSIVRTERGTLIMQGFGVPGRLHSFEAKTEINGPFQTVGFATADAQGLVSYETSGSQLDLNFYRFTVQ